jgi:hypothetical protein
MVMSSTLAGIRNAFMGLIVLIAALAAIATVNSDAALASSESASSPVLPDGRGYEKVSPNENDDGNVYMDWPVELAENPGGYTTLPFEAASDGNAVVYIGEPSEEGGIGHEGGNDGNQYLARRNVDGRWEASNIMPPSDENFTIPVYQSFSPDLTQGLLVTNSGSPLVEAAPAAHYFVPYAHNFQTGAYESLLPAVPPDRSYQAFGAYETANATKKLQPVFAGSTTDFSHVLYMANDALTPGASDGGEEDNNLYDFTAGSLHLVNVLPDGVQEQNAVFGGPVIPPAEPGYKKNDPDFSHVISEDGSRIFWTGQGENRNIYMREGDTRTVQVDAGAGGEGQYWTATPSGSKVLFTKNGDLYEYDVETGQTTDLVPSGEVQGVVGTSDDLSYVYFVADAALAPQATQGTCSSDECNLYVLHAGEPIRFISKLAEKDDTTSPTSFYFQDGDWEGALGQKEAEVTSEGKQVLFSSILPLTGYDNNKEEELYAYEYEVAKLRCISCNRTGEPPQGNYSAFLPVSHQGTYSLHWMSSDGSRVFFNSRDPLVAQDTNGVNDVYEWERDGSGACAEAEGCIYLISGGTAGEGNFLVDASASGDDVFFTTRAKLVAEDQNENVDVYDAHVGAAPPPAEPQCTGTGCQGVPSAPAVFSTPSSVTYNGVGNFPHAEGKPKKKARAKKTAPAKHKRKQRDGKRKGSRKARRAGVGMHRSVDGNGRSK